MEFSTDYNPIYSSFSKDHFFSPKPVKVMKSSVQKTHDDFKDEETLIEDFHDKDLNLLTRYSSFVKLEPQTISENSLGEWVQQKRENEAHTMGHSAINFRHVSQKPMRSSPFRSTSKENS